MAEPVPASLRHADITRFINRANQLREVKPAVTYWCEYWVVNQILSKQLHTTDEESLNYTTNLMDRLEQTKAEHAADEAITDDAVGQAVVEEFAQHTFSRAERVLKANKVSRQTADTFDAAATFFQLLNIWGQPDVEAQKKIKYAKWNAARILKAIREGKDPNESNPKQQEAEADTDLPTLDPNDPDVRVLDGAGTSRGATAKPATVEDDPDTEFYTNKTPSAAAAYASVPTPPAKSPTQPSPSAPGPADLGTVPTASPGYFPPTVPFAPSPVSQTAASDIHLPSVPSAPSPVSRLNSPWNQPPPPSSGAATAPPPTSGYYQQAPPPPPAPSQPQPQSQLTPQVHVLPPAIQHIPVTAPADAFSTVEGDIPGATKHARFAISALNFEDVPTAIKELRAALTALGARP
ncbi:DUF605-domain-containing protein [Sodiomyces alkalinus F11]|uniref:DUF605-domain-containing protein n=1 Tax=Sodiomyces alkalinus (strain CBS 110278 / VKM F-3762 / F11) TaxID=1314773 RepID=A0A3N2PZ12_SODAK|nr:DUF605-domain-containing protein [Sodiomyces alkalinus F11]ROT39666.1 DUF605-domain-containing protein [Sodiomyces alkalinus F11]